MSRATRRGIARCVHTDRAKLGRYCPMGRRRAGRTGRWTTTRGVSPLMRMDLEPSESSLHVLGRAKETRMVMVANARQTSLSPIVLYIGQ